MPEKFLITGATGKTAELAIERLVAQRADVRALVRDLGKAAPLEEKGVELVRGDFHDSDSLVSALDGVTSVFLVTPPDEHTASTVDRFLAAATASGKRPRIVRLSAIQASEGGPTDNTRQHGRADRALIESGLPFTILRPNYFLQNFFGSVETILGNGMIVHATGEGRLGFIDVRDIADVAAAVLLDARWDRGIYELTGPESLSFADVAREVSQALGREVSCVQVSPDALRAALLEKGWGPWVSQLLADYSAAYARGWGDFTTSFVEKITGHEARSASRFVREVLAPALTR